jgi:hypothetical protein
LYLRPFSFAARQNNGSGTGNFPEELSGCTESQLSGIYDKISGMKRVFLFVAVNLAVMFLLMLAVNVILSLAGPDVRESM